MQYVSTPDTLLLLLQLLGKQLDILGVPELIARAIFLGEIPGTSFQLTFAQIITCILAFCSLYIALKIYKNHKPYHGKYARVRH